MSRAGFSEEEQWEIDPVKQLIAQRSQRNLMAYSSERIPSKQPRRSSRSQSLRGSTDKSEYDKTARSQSFRGSTDKSECDKTDSSVSIRSISTMQSQMSRGTMERHQEDLVDENNNDGQTEVIVSPSSWICYRLILMGLLAVSVSVAGFIISCKSFRIDSYYDVENVYYGLRGVTDQTTGRCVGWKIQDLVNWNDDWTDNHLPAIFIVGIVGVTLVFVGLIAFVVYGIDLKSRRDHQRKGAMWPAVVIGIFLIGAGILVAASIIGNCKNIPPLGPGGLGCDLHVWSGLAMASSIALCFMGGCLACCLPLCCGCRFLFLRRELID